MSVFVERFDSDVRRWSARLDGGESGDLLNDVGCYEMAGNDARHGNGHAHGHRREDAYGVIAGRTGVLVMSDLELVAGRVPMGYG
jgi:hypothetical protein